MIPCYASIAAAQEAARLGDENLRQDEIERIRDEILRDPIEIFELLSDEERDRITERAQAIATKRVECSERENSFRGRDAP